MCWNTSPHLLRRALSLLLSPVESLHPFINNLAVRDEESLCPDTTVKLVARHCPQL